MLHHDKTLTAPIRRRIDDLVEALMVAIVIVIALLAYSLGWREGLIIAFAVPVTFSLSFGRPRP